jgi:hypothetical protein
MRCQRRQAGRIRLRIRVDRQKIVVAGHERGDPIFVLGPQDGAGDVDDAPALLDETQRAFERFVLILDALLERAGADAPFGVRIAPPGARAGAGRVDQHQIATSLEVGEHVRFTPRGPHLDIAGPRTGEPREDWRKAMRVRVGGVDLSLVLHRGGERQRLAVPGDIVFLETGNHIPADVRLLEAVNLRIEEAALTGESQAAEKNATAMLEHDVPLGDRTNTAFMGTLVSYGRGQGVVVATGMKTQLGMIEIGRAHV